MPNVFDQFDAPQAGNVFDQFDAPTKSVPEPGITLPYVGRPSLIGMAKGLYESAKNAMTLPSEVYAGKVDPESDEGIKRAFDMATMVALPSAGRTQAVRPAVPAPIPENPQIRTAARAGYEHPEVQAVQIQPAAVEQFANRVAGDLNQRGQLSVPESAAGAHAVLDRLRNTGTTPGLPHGVASIQELRSAQSALSGMSTELNLQGRPTPNAAAAGHASREISQFLGNLRQPELIAGNAQRASEILRQANRDWAAQAKSELVGLQQMKADRQAGRSGSGSNIENSMRQKIDTIFGPGKVTRAGLTAEQQAAADRLVMGSPTRNALRKVGKLGFSDGLSLLLHAGAALPTMGASIPVGIAGTIARKLGERMTRNDIAALERSFRQASTEAQRWQAIQNRINPSGTLQLPSLRVPPPGLPLAFPQSSESP